MESGVSVENYGNEILSLFPEYQQLQSNKKGSTEVKYMNEANMNLPLDENQVGE